ncbi:hypothetical protein [Marinobacter sp.]|uniref:hypothetical protein n=1 Tax=Marinobacter sp. TaxID=50741 RepID=UPI00356582F0
MKRIGLPTGIPAFLIAVIAPLFPAPTIQAADFHLPQPWQQEAVVEGRAEIYNSERFLNELSFRHQHPPGPTQQGIRGTAGSARSKRLFMDFRFYRDFAFDNEHQGFLLDIQRSEDLDGAFDRQLVGFRHTLNNTDLRIHGDVFHDKSLSDIYLAARHRFSGGDWLEAAWILPDAYFNSKTETNDEFATKPQSLFLQWHRGRREASRDGGSTLSLNVSPESELVSRSAGLSVRSRSVKAALTQSFLFQQAEVTLSGKGEYVRRTYQLEEGGSPEFTRDHFQLMAEVAPPGLRLSPRLGVSGLYLDETGYFGRSINNTGTVRRREANIFGSVSFQLTPRTDLAPELFLGTANVRQKLEGEPQENHTGFIGKVAFPVNILLSATDNAMLTINPTFYLHKSNFGGGNVQLHWPM